MLLHAITTALAAVADPEFQVRQQGYSKEPIRSMGVRVGAMREIAKSFFPEVKSLPMQEFLATCEQLLREGTVEHTTIAFTWAYRRRKELLPAHFEVLLHWLQDFVSHWAACDQLCCEVFGDFLLRYPDHAPQVRGWAMSDNRWLRRAAAVVLIPDLRRNASFFPLLIDVATTLLPDRDDLVQKGCGWALKTAMETMPLDTWAFVTL